MRKTRRMAKQGGLRGRNRSVAGRSTGGRVNPRASAVGRRRGASGRGRGRNFQSGGAAFGGRSRNSRNRNRTRGRRNFQSGGYNGGRRNFQSGGYSQSAGSVNYGGGGLGLGIRQGGDWESTTQWTLNNIHRGANADGSFSGWTLKNPPGPDRGQYGPSPDAINKSVLARNPFNPPGAARFDGNKRGQW